MLNSRHQKLTIPTLKPACGVYGRLRSVFHPKSPENLPFTPTRAAAPAPRRPAAGPFPPIKQKHNDGWQSSFQPPVRPSQ
jgi:hypothetical protein